MKLGMRCILLGLVLRQVADPLIEVDYRQRYRHSASFVGSAGYGLVDMAEIEFVSTPPSIGQCQW